MRVAAREKIEKRINWLGLGVRGRVRVRMRVTLREKIEKIITWLGLGLGLGLGLR